MLLHGFISLEKANVPDPSQMIPAFFGFLTDVMLQKVHISYSLRTLQKRQEGSVDTGLRIESLISLFEAAHMVKVRT